MTETNKPDYDGLRAAVADLEEKGIVPRKEDSEGDNSNQENKNLFVKLKELATTMLEDVKEELASGSESVVASRLLMEDTLAEVKKEIEKNPALKDGLIFLKELALGVDGVIALGSALVMVLAGVYRLVEGESLDLSEMNAATPLLLAVWTFFITQPSEFKRLQGLQQ